MNYKTLIILFSFVFCAYFIVNDYKKKNLCVKVPVRFSIESTRPIIDIWIEKQRFPTFLDLGSSFPIVLEESFFDQLERAPHKTLTEMNFKGDCFSSASYFIPKVSLASFIWKNVLGKEMNSSVKNKLIFSEEKTPAQIGKPILETVNMLLDFPHEALYLCDNLKILQKKKLLSKNLVKAPFFLHDNLIFVEVETDLGKRMLLFDTGANNSIIANIGATLDKEAKSNFFTSNRFILGGHDFGKQELYKVEYAIWEGAVGMTFIKHFPIYIDYKNKTLYIDYSSERKSIQ